jgi:hypothetical protein
MQVLRDLRQLLHPKEFRIPAPVLPPDLAEAVRILERTLSAVPRQAEAAPQGIDGETLAAVGTGLWRLRRRMLEPGTDRPLDEMRRAYRHLESVLDALEQVDVKIYDHTGDVVPKGGVLKLDIIAFQPTAGVQRETVIETVRPTIYYQGRMLQMGQVIVGTPESLDSSTEGASGGSVS